MPNQQQQRLGFIYGLSSYLIWGLFPLYFYFLQGVAPLQILTHRIIWSFLLVMALSLLLKRWDAVVKAIRSPAIFSSLLLSSVLIAANWLIFIWAVGQHRVLESSLGYFLTPLVSVLLAYLFLKEHIDPYRWLAVAFAVLGVVWQLLHLGHLPWVSLALAGTFGLYGLVRKKVPVDALTGLVLETGMLILPALAYLEWLHWQGTSQFLTAGSLSTFLLVASGAVTALPLILFAAATKKLSLTAIGFMMYINPTMQFLTAILVFKEHFTHSQFISFLFIWAGLTVFSLGALRQHRKTALASP